MWWKANKWKVLTPVLIVAVLAAAFWYGGNAPGLQGWTTAQGDQNTPGGQDDTPQQDTVPPQNDILPAVPPADGNAVSGETGRPDQASPSGDGTLPPEEPADKPSGTKDETQTETDNATPNTGKDKYLTDPVPDGQPLPVEPEDANISDTAYTCTISISCAAILNHMDWLDPEKEELVPADGWVLEPATVTFYEGESVFNVLQRTCKQQKIHMEFTNTPMYNSAYIEGIHNLYEFDCGELSGWMYSVNDWFPNYGCSRYALQDGDTICWQYTCDLGEDIGGYNALGS